MKDNITNIVLTYHLQYDTLTKTTNGCFLRGWYQSRGSAVPIMTKANNKKSVQVLITQSWLFQQVPHSIQFARIKIGQCVVSRVKHRVHLPLKYFCNKDSHS